jgi:CDP-diacylglycerol---serine O-phosphatidyltransferase
MEWRLAATDVMESTRLNPTPVRGRGRALRVLKTVPILPSLVTLGNVFFGFLAMAKAGDAIMLTAKSGGLPTPEAFHKLEVASLLIFVAMVFDALDGAVARMTRQTSAFGAQLDSLADMVTFGVAPAFLAKVLIDFHCVGEDPLLTIGPRIIYVSAVVYVLCGAMRLARFNVEISSDAAEDHQEFAGLPSPAGAAVIAGLLYFFCALKADPASQSALVHWLDGYGLQEWVVRIMPICLVMTGLLMVSRFPYPHVMVTLLRGGHSFPFLATIVVLVLGIALEHEFGLVLIFSLYLLSGLTIGMFRLVTTGQLHRKGDMEPFDDDGSMNPPHLN